MNDDARGSHRRAHPHPRARMSGIDLHTHLAPKFGQTKPYPHGAADEGGSLVIDGKHIGPDALYRPQSLVDYLDQAALDTAIVTLPPPFYRQHLPKRQAAQWVRAVNDGMLAAVEAQPRLRALAYLPLEHPDVAILEYERIRSADAWAGVTACAGGSSASQADAALDPLWSALDADARLPSAAPRTLDGSAARRLLPAQSARQPNRNRHSSCSAGVRRRTCRSPGGTRVAHALRRRRAGSGRVVGSAVRKPPAPECRTESSLRLVRAADSTSTASRMTPLRCA